MTPARKVKKTTTGKGNEKKKSTLSLILHNDEINTFDHVIDCLIEVCEHQPEQAEQCAFITHYTGKCDVKKGPEAILRIMKRQLIDMGLSVTIEEVL